MKKCLTIAAIALAAPFAAQAEVSAASDSIRSCVDAFVAERFPGSTPTIRIEDDRFSYQPLMLRNVAMTVQVVATDKATGRTLASATCKVKGSVLTVQTREVAERVAQN